MPRLIFLGTANAIPDEQHENTHLVLQGETRTILIDCVNNQILRLRKVGVDHADLTDIVLTHFHPDHVSGVPQMLMNMWLMGRRKPLNLHGLHHTLDRVEGLMGFYGWEEWPDFFPVTFHRLPAIAMVPVVDCDELAIWASPVRHMIPAIGLRFVLKQHQKIIAYSCDTEPCPQVIRLAEGADILIHEAAGAFLGHSSARQAAEVAQQAGARKLFLIHYPTDDTQNLVQQAGDVFSGEVVKAEDLMSVEL